MVHRVEPLLQQSTEDLAQRFLENPVRSAEFRRIGQQPLQHAGGLGDHFLRRVRQIMVRQEGLEDGTIPDVHEVVGPETLADALDPITVLDHEKEQLTLRAHFRHGGYRGVAVIPAPRHPLRRGRAHGPRQLGLQRISTHPGAFRNLRNIYVPQSGILDRTQCRKQPVDGGPCVLDAPEMIALFQDLELLVEDVDGPIDVALERLGPLGANDGIRILSWRECDDARVHASGQEQIRGSERRLEPGRVTIEQEVSLRRIAAENRHLVCSDHRSKRGNRILESGRCEGHDIHVALHHESRLPPADRVLRPVQPVKDFSLVVDRRLRGVDVFGRTLPSGTQHPTTETHHLPGETLDGKDEPAAESVVGILSAFHCG